MFVQWDNESMLMLYTKELAITEDLFDSSIKVEFTTKTNTSVINYFNNWYGTR